MNKKNVAEVSVESIADPGVQFNLGNIIMNFSRGNLGGVYFNVIGALLCLAVRGVGELRKKGVFIKLPKILNKLVENPGAALAVNGVLMLGASFSAAASFDSSQPETALPVVINGAFGSGNLVQGTARGFKEGSVQQRLSDAYAQAAYPVGLYFAAGENVGIVLTTVFTVSAVVGVAHSFDKLPKWFNPNLINAGAAFSGAVNSMRNPAMSVANAFWGAGYLSLAALQYGGGVMGAFKKVVKRKISSSHDEEFKPAGP